MMVCYLLNNCTVCTVFYWKGVFIFLQMCPGGIFSCSLLLLLDFISRCFVGFAHSTLQRQKIIKCTTSIINSMNIIIICLNTEFISDLLFGSYFLIHTFFNVIHRMGTKC